MTDELMELGRRAVACTGWRWLPGMLALAPGRAPLRLAVEAAGYLWWGSDGTEQDGLHLIGPAAIPDLSDPATLGCLLSLVRRAWGEPAAYVARQPQATAKPWRVWLPGDPVGYGTTEAEALVAALEAAPVAEEEPQTWEEDWGNERE